MINNVYYNMSIENNLPAGFVLDDLANYDICECCEELYREDELYYVKRHNEHWCEICIYEDKLEL